jgi:hypothetical protein
MNENAESGLVGGLLVGELGVCLVRSNRLVSYSEIEWVANVPNLYPISRSPGNC